MGALLSFLGSLSGLKFVLNVASAVSGVVGTWLMSRRYAHELPRAVLYAVITPVLFMVGRGARVRNFFKAKINTDLDVPESVTSTVFGLSLLFWAFFLQLIVLFIEVVRSDVAGQAHLGLSH